MEPVKQFKHKTAISPSRLDLYLECSQRYAYRYLYKGPDSSNDGAKRGSTVHDVLEILLNPRHKHYVDSVIENRTCTLKPGLWRLIQKYAAKYEVDDDENLTMIDGFMYIACKNEFYGPPDTIKTLAEQDFDFEVERPGISYRVRGFIDKIHLIEEDGVISCTLVDYKSSKARYTGEKATNNHQAIIYQLAVKHLFPDYRMRGFRFLFLRMPRKPIQMMELLTDAQLAGYEYWLTNIQQQLETFTEADASCNYAAHDPDMKIQRCGGEGFKADGSVRFICGAQRPLDFYAVVDKDNKHLYSVFTEEEARLKEGERVEKRHYAGCQYFFKDGERIRS